MKKISLILVLVCSMTTLFAQWSNLNSGITENLLSVDFATIDTGFVVGATTLYSTTNGGVTWNPVSISNFTGDSALFSVCTFKEVQFVNGMWYAIGRDFTNYDPVIFRKSQSATSEWELSYLGDSLALNAMDGNSNVVAVVGGGGLIIYSVDLGLTWDTATGYTSNNLKCISMNSNSYTYIGSYNGFVVNGYFPSSNFYFYSSPGFEGMMTKNSGYLFGFNQNTFYTGWSGNFSGESDYLGGLLPNDVERITDTSALFATPTGILKSYESMNHWEYYPNTIGTSFNCVKTTTAAIAYAVGDSGAIFKTTNIFSPTTPTIIFDGLNGACDDSLLTFTNSGPLSYSYTWKVNGTAFSNQYNEDSTFTSTGTYNVTLIADNGSLIDSLTYSFQIVDVPDTNKIISITDSILCQEGSTDITIQLSESNVEYQLLLLPSMTPVSTVYGNGGNAILNTGFITDSTNYVISAKHVNAACTNYFTDSILIAVEHTLAKFKPHLINADLGESVTFYNASEQASLYNWTFSSGASSGTSVQSVPQIFYNITGQTTTTLIATSQHGCSDTLTKNSAYVYDKYNYLDPNWAVGFEGVEIPTYEHDNAEAIRITSGGDIIVSGSYNNVEFKTKAGNTSGMNSGIGFYIARYTSEGVLKWMVKGQDDGNASSSSYGVGTCSDFVLDAQDNIYAVGQIGAGYMFYSNNGETTRLDDSLLYDEGLVMKLDSNGNLLWHTGMDAATPKSVGIDASNNVYLSGDYHHLSKFYSVSGSYVSYNTGWQAQQFLLKMDNLGEIIWSTTISSTSPGYYFDLNDMSVSPNGDAYIVGQFGSQVTFNGVSGTSVAFSSVYGAEGYVVKYNTNGVVKWAHNITSNNVITSSTHNEVLSVEQDQNGNIYLGCEVSANELGEYVFIPSSNGAMDSAEIGRAVLISYNSAGNFRWVNGGAYSYTGHYNDVAVDIQGNIYGTGVVSPWSGSTTNLYTTFTSTGSTGTIVYAPGSMFLTKYDSIGNLIFVKMEYDTAFGSGRAGPVGIQVSQSQHVYVAAMSNLYNGESDYILSTDTINPNGTDAFLVKFSPSGNLSQDTLFCSTNPGYLCSNENVYLSSISSVSYGVGNVFSVEISDSTGSFTSPIIIGSINSSNLIDSILVNIPSGLSGSGYKIRIHSSNPNIIGNETDVNLAQPTSSQSLNYTICQGDILSLNAGVGNNYLWSGTDSISDTTLVNPLIYPDTSVLILAQFNSFCGLVVDSFDVVVNPSYTNAVQEIHICDNESALIFGNYTSIPGIYVDSAQTINGCDSIITIQLISHPTSAMTSYHSICSNDSMLVFGSYTNISGLYVDTVQSINGCDSIIKINLQVLPSYFIELTDTICALDSSFFAGNYHSASGVYYDNQIASSGCDSVTVLSLEVLPPLVVSLDPFQMGTYCENGGLIPLPNGFPSGGMYSGPGVSGNYFDPSLTGIGSYHLIYSYTDLYGCSNSDTSLITIVNCTGIQEGSTLTDVKVYPNPTHGKVTITGISAHKNSAFVEVRDVNGKLVSTYEIPSNRTVFELNLYDLSAGVYFISVRFDEDIRVFEILKQ